MAPDEIREWLDRHGFGKYAEAFIAQDIGLDILRDLSEQDLNELGISIGDRRRLRRLISEERHGALAVEQTLGDSLPGLVAYVNADETYGFVNDACERWYGRSAADINGRHLSDVMTESTYGHVRPHVQAALAGDTVCFETEATCRDGRKRWVRVEYVPDKSPSGNVRGVFALSHDLSAHHEMQRRLEESEARFRDLIENAVQGVVILDETDRPLFANRASASIFGYDTPEQITGLGSLEPLLADATRPPEVPSGQESVSAQDGNGGLCRLKGRRRDGSIVWLLCQPRDVVWSDRRCRQLTINDVTVQKKADAQLRLREAQLEALFDNAPIVIGIKGADGRWQRVNRHYSRVLGVTENQIIGKFSTEVFDEAIATAGEDLDEEVRRTRAAASRVIPNPTVEGLRDFLQIKFPILDGEGELRQIGLFALDISERVKLEEAIRTSEERFRDFANAASDWFWEVDEDLRYTYISPSFERETGTPAAVVLGRSIQEMAAERYPDGAIQTFLDLARQRKECRDLILRRVLSDLPDRWVTLSAVPFFRDDGSFAGYRGTVKDTTEEKHARADLQRNEALLLEAQRIGNIGHWERDFSSETIVWSDQVFRIFGLEPGEKHPTLAEFKSCIHPDDLPVYEEVGRQALASQPGFDLEHRIVQPDGSIRIVRERAEIIRDEDGELRRIVGTVQDITEAGLAEQEMLEQEARFRAVVDNSPFSLMLKRTDGRIRLLNKTYQKWFGVKSRDAKGRRSADLFPPDVARNMEALDARVLAEQKPVEALQPVKLANGLEHQFRLTKFPVKGTDGKIIGIGSIGVDETERMALEQRLRQGEKMQAIGHLTGGVAHEFNNMMQIILSNTELLMGRLESDPGAYRQLDAMRRTALRGSELTSRLLAFSRRQALRPRLTELGELAQECIELLRQTIGPSIRIETDVSDDLWQIAVDQTELQNAIVNLVINARDAIAGTGSIAITAGNCLLTSNEVAAHGDLAPGNYVRLSIRDDGSGMTPEVQARAFDPFYTTKGPGDGTGLGLSMVYGFVRQSGGFAEIDSTMGVGTTVSVYLPRHEAGIVQPLSGDAGNEAASGQPARILVVEDDPDVRETVCAMLNAQGHLVEAVADVATAFECLARESVFDLVISDIMMPGEFNGFAVAELVKSSHPKTRLLLVSGDGTLAPDLDAAGRMPIEAPILRKPFSQPDLAKAVANALSDNH